MKHIHKMVLLCSLFFIAATVSLTAQDRLSAKMVEDLIWTQLPLPRNDFHQYFENFNQEIYGGRTFFYQRELQDVAASFTMYLLYNGYGTDSTPAPSNEFPSTHIVTDKLRLRKTPSLTAETITILNVDTKVQVVEKGASITVDGITAPWVRVKTEKGETGWCFSGYLMEF